MENDEWNNFLNGLSGEKSTVTVPDDLVSTAKACLGERVASGWLARKSREGVTIYSGTEEPVTAKWNAALYETGKKGCKLTSCDLWTLRKVLEGSREDLLPRDRLAEIDDAGWGSPIGGTMVGVAMDGELATAVVPIEVYRPSCDLPTKMRFDEHHRIYSEKGLELVQEEVGPPAPDLTLCICTGYANLGLRERLRAEGYHVILGEIRGAAQDGLETAYGEYLEKLTGCKGLYRDPKELTPKDRAQAYSDLVTNPRMQPFLKTCWKSLRKTPVGVGS